MHFISLKNKINFFPIQYLLTSKEWNSSRYPIQYYTYTVFTNKQRMEFV